MNKKNWLEALERVGIQQGDCLLVHSDLRPFGLPEGCKTNEEILHFYYAILRERLGPQGTLLVPAYFYEYARFGTPFDIDTAPVSKPLGVFSAYVNGLPGRVRSANPLQSLAAIGPAAETVCGGDSLMGYGLSSPWQRLRLHQAKMLFLGVTLQPMTFVHHIEQQFGVPHLYQKIYSTPILRQGKPLPGQAISAVRYLDFHIHYDLAPFQLELKKRGQLQETSLADSSLFGVSFEEAFQTGIDLLSQNPYCFLKRPPTFIPGQIPADGVTGPLSVQVIS